MLEKVAEFKVAGAKFEVLSDIRTLEKQVRAFGERGVTSAHYRALNRSANKSKTETKRILAAKYNIKSGDIAKFLDVNPKASPRGLTVAIRGRSSKLSIYKYAKGAKRQTPRGVRFNSGGGSKVHPHTFIATMPSGHTGIFVKSRGESRREPRVNKAGKRYLSELPIRELEYPSVGHMLVNDVNANKIYGVFIQDFPNQLMAQLDYQLQRSKGA